MSVDSHFKSKYLLKQGSKITLETDVLGGCYDLLGFFKEVACIELKTDVMDIKQSAKDSVNNDAKPEVFVRTNTICGKQVILKTNNLSGKVVVINKNVEFPLKCQSLLENSFGGDSITAKIFSKLHNVLDSSAIDNSCANLQSHQSKDTNRCANIDNDDLLKVTLDGDKIKNATHLPRTNDSGEPDELVCKKPLKTYKGKRIITASATRFERNPISFKLVKKVESGGLIDDGVDPTMKLKIFSNAGDGKSYAIKIGGLFVKQFEDTAKAKKIIGAKIISQAKSSSVDESPPETKPSIHSPKTDFIKLKTLNNTADCFHEFEKQMAKRAQETLLHRYLTNDLIGDDTYPHENDFKLNESSDRNNLIDDSQISPKNDVKLNDSSGRSDSIDDSQIPPKNHVKLNESSGRSDSIDDSQIPPKSDVKINESCGRETKVKENRVIKVRQKRQARRSMNKQLYFMREFEKFMKSKRRTKQEKLVRKSRGRDFSCQVHSEISNSSTQTDITGNAWEDLSKGGKDFDDDVVSYEEKPIIGSDVHMGFGPKMSPYRGDSHLNRKIACVDNEMSSISSQELVMFNSCIVDETHKQKFHEYLMNCTEVDPVGNLQIHLHAMNNDSLEVRRQCIMLRLRQISIDTVNNNELTPLHLAIIYGCIQPVDELLKYGAEIGLIDADGNNGIHLAVLNNEGMILKKLLLEGKQRLVNVDAYNYDGFTPLMLCALERKSELASWLLQNGADPNLKDQKSGRTPLFHAVENDDIDMARLLLRNNADTKIRNFFGTSTHEAMFELENINIELKTMIIGKDMYQNKKKVVERKKRSKPEDKEEAAKRPRMKTTQTFRKIKHM